MARNLKVGDAVSAFGPYPCPFCVGTFSVCIDPPAVVHTVPVCTKFTDLEPDGFLRAARFARALS